VTKFISIYYTHAQLLPSLSLNRRSFLNGRVYRKIIIVGFIYNVSSIVSNYLHNINTTAAAAAAAAHTHYNNVQTLAAYVTGGGGAISY